MTVYGRDRIVSRLTGSMDIEVQGLEKRRLALVAGRFSHAPINKAYSEIPISVVYYISINQI